MRLTRRRLTAGTLAAGAAAALLQTRAERPPYFVQVTPAGMTAAAGHPGAMARTATPAAVNYVLLTMSHGPAYQESLRIERGGALSYSYRDMELSGGSPRPVEKACSGSLEKETVEQVFQRMAVFPPLAGEYEPHELVFDGITRRMQAELDGTGTTYRARSYHGAGPQALHELYADLWKLRARATQCVQGEQDAGRRQEAARAMQMRDSRTE